MPNPFFALLILALIFCLFLLISVLLNILYHYKANNNQDKTQNQQRHQSKNRVYRQNQTKQANFSERKKPDIALKSKILFSPNQNKHSDNN